MATVVVEAWFDMSLYVRSWFSGSPGTKHYLNVLMTSLLLPEHTDWSFKTIEWFKLHGGGKLGCTGDTLPSHILYLL